MNRYLRRSLFAGTMVALNAVAGNPVVCSQGYWDATCAVNIVRVRQTPPACSSDPGWTTVLPAQWQGSHYSAPQCIYQAPPTCPTGNTQLDAPTWNESSWVGLTCIPSAPNIPTMPQYTAACKTALASFNTGLGWQGNAYGPFTESNVNGSIPATANGGWMFVTQYVDRTYSGPSDLVWAAVMNGAAGDYVGCWFEQGTTKIYVLQYAWYWNYDGG